ncbi:MAG TPA: phosphomethylpyrimidine synthase ThiC, partial [Gammaproteobacteria bacterium]|nr:phosphomethylpyrimidine synthase ThiC [Gammaproteobacteria bacterium]
MNAVPESFDRPIAHVDEQVVQPFPNSRKIYVQGSRADIKVPMREIRLADTSTPMGHEKNPPIWVYDTSGPYTDPAIAIDIHSGMPALRLRWIEERGDTELLSDLSSDYGRKRARDSALAALRFPQIPKPRRAKPDMNVTQMHYARRGIITTEMEFVAIRENMRLEAIKDAALRKRHKGMRFGAEIPDEITPEFVRAEVARGRAIIPA